MLVRALKAAWIPWACVVFILLNTLLMSHEVYWLNLLPAALIVVWALVAAVDKLLLFIAFATPLSINMEQMEMGGIGVALPTEPLMVAVLALFLLRVALQRGVIAPNVWKHPVTIVLLAQLAWMAVCILPSSMPLVSLKYLTARLWFVCSMYLLGTRLFEDPKNMHRFAWAYLLGLCLVITYTIAYHAQYRFAQDPAHWVMQPFFKDHTSYGAIIAFFVPFGVAAAGMPGYSRSRKGLAVFLLLILIAGLILSYTRAAWVSLVGALAVFIVMRMRIPAWVVGAGVVVIGGIYLANYEQITLSLERNRDESSDDLAKHVSSISNISSDASNLERINRWHSALRMFEQRPFFGWGPGTYMFQYAPFQASEDRTIISTNFGLQGNAHSEFLGPLSEQGVLGMLLMIALITTVCITAIRLYSRMPNGMDKRIVGAAFVGLMTYYIHGTLNNFLDLDKASVPFWAFTAMIVMLDLKYPRAVPAPPQA
ncbi:MAG TPA: O-antigen ligase family protein [Flavobacteriales bacterium]|jgi:O-antigen ligase|nr:O-antigen ligase family protein [Flavobacteriales bacterium]